MNSCQSIYESFCLCADLWIIYRYVRYSTVTIGRYNYCCKLGRTIKLADSGDKDITPRENSITKCSRTPSEMPTT